MTEIIGVRFRASGKVHYFSPDGHTLCVDDGVIVSTVRGMTYATVCIPNCHLPESMLPQEVMPILRRATEEDRMMMEELERESKQAFVVCATKIAFHQLDMKLIQAEYALDRSKLIFYFSSENRVDFRELVRDLAQTFHTRIELRQIGVRDEAKMMGGLGACGQEVCCHRYMNDFVKVSIKMAKTQGLSLNPVKISGVCGRLMCCLNYEQEHYLENAKQVPEKGTLVLTEDGQGHVVDCDILQKRVRVHVYKDDNTEEEKYFSVDDIDIVEKRKKGHPRPALHEDLRGVKRTSSEGGCHCKQGCQHHCADPLESASLVAESSVFENKMEETSHKNLHFSRDAEDLTRRETKLERDLPSIPADRKERRRPSRPDSLPQSVQPRPKFRWAQRKDSEKHRDAESRAGHEQRLEPKQKMPGEKRGKSTGQERMFKQASKEGQGRRPYRKKKDRKKNSKKD